MIRPVLRSAWLGYAGLRRVAPPSVDAALGWVQAVVTRDRVRRTELSAAIARHRARPDELFVGWVLSGDEGRGTTRLRGLIPHAELCRRGVNSVILRKPRFPGLPFEPPRAARQAIVHAGFDAVLLEGRDGPGVDALVRALTHTATKTVYVVGDLTQDGLPELVDWMVVGSRKLAELARGRLDRVTVIEAPIDAPPGLVKDYSIPPPTDKVRIVWVGYPENLPLLEPVKTALKDPRLSKFRLITISRGPNVTFQWDRLRVSQQILACDIAVLPSAPTDWHQAKPNTRMTMFKALGLPIVASPVPAYLETLSHGRSCYFARDAAEWVEALTSLADVERRRRIGLADRDAVLGRYGSQAIGDRWLALLEQVVGRRHRAPPMAL